MFLYVRYGQMLTWHTQVPCNSRGVRNRTDSVPSACVRFEQQDFPGEEEERLEDGHMTIVACLARQEKRGSRL